MVLLTLLMRRKNVEDEKAIATRIRIENGYKNGASWFYWIAGMSILNEIFYQTHTGWIFAIGLGITQVTNVIFQNNGVSFVATLILSGIFVFFGKMAHQGYRWAFITGMIFYILDAILFIMVKDYIGLGLHGLAIVGIYRGLRLHKQLIEINNNQALKPSEEGAPV